ncbi:unnamed protein product [Pleuronectes platessa]|uniref:Uncharacterized protein n=1 Tax=Pleuronectes platessa TaxID=8262 RepID=A0A9N7VBM5_PLEPL|nr:unnamed protein product [Pleuronectes platessa]
MAMLSPLSPQGLVHMDPGLSLGLGIHLQQNHYPLTSGEQTVRPRTAENRTSHRAETRDTARGIKGSRVVADTKAGEPRLNSPEAAAAITGGFLLHNHSHYCANTHLGSSCGADDERPVKPLPPDTPSGPHSSKQLSAPAPANGPAALPPVCHLLSL